MYYVVCWKIYIASHAKKNYIITRIDFKKQISNFYGTFTKYFSQTFLQWNIIACNLEIFIFILLQYKLWKSSF